MDGSQGRWRVLERGVYRGPHLYSHTPMIRLMLDLGPLQQRPSSTIPDFTPRLLDTLPGLGLHGCSYRKPGGFARRLSDGTWAGHIVEHVALELQTRAGVRATRGKTRSVRGRPGLYNVLYAYGSEPLGLMAGRLALALVDQLLPPDLAGVTGLDLVDDDPAEPAYKEPFALPLALEALRRRARRTAFGPTTQALVDAALRRGIPVSRLDEQSLVLLGEGRHQQRLRASITGRTSLVAAEAAGNKNLTKSLLADAGVPVPRGQVVRNPEEAVRAAEKLRYPVVTKPLDGNHGRGVTVDLRDADAVRAGFAAAALVNPRVIVEQYLTGRDYRLLVIGGQLAAAAERVPARVVGDGAQTIAHLIAIVNADPRRGAGHGSVMTRIRLDHALTALLAKSGRSFETVPAPGEVVVLRDTANLSTGGIAIDRTDEVHPDNALIARRAALAVGLDIAGIDLLAPDIRRSVRETGGGVVEVNAAPGFRMHLAPSEGRARDVAAPVIAMLFPPGAPRRVPVLAVTGTNGKSTTARMLAHVIGMTGRAVGLTSTSGVFVDGQRVVTGDATGPRSARLVLRDPMVEVAVLETARGGILREGLGFTHADVGAVLNVTADHLGLGGIDTLADLARVKSLVVESVRRRGTSVLNADDPIVLRMRRHARGRIALFSLHGGEATAPAVCAHIAAGGMVALREPGPDGGDLVLFHRGSRTLILAAREVPATVGGLADFNIANALAALLMARAHRVPIGTIRDGLASFTASFEQNPGRLNIRDAHGLRIIVDYAHNPAGLDALGGLIANLRPAHRRVWGVIAAPGDRRDEDIRAFGALAAGIFDEIVLREDPGRRGRRPGEVLDLIVAGLAAEGFGLDRVARIAHERDAADHCLRQAQPGDLVVLIATSIDEVWAQVEAYAAETHPLEQAVG